MRRAGPGDAAAIRSLTRAVYAKWIPSIGREPRPMATDYDVAVRQHWIDLHEVNGILLALIEMVPASNHLWIHNIAVSESHQRNGIGKALLSHAVSIARMTGFKEIRLNTNATFTANLDFYRHMGFLESGREPLPDGGTMVQFTKTVS
jgi:ribosomal protein S18 acetylase RimI-like enzyme